MANSNHNKIVILEDSQADQDYIKAVVESAGHLPFVFDKETTFFNNIFPIDADLIIFRAVSIEKVSRILNTLLFFHYNKPVIIISDKSEIRDFIASIPGIHAGIIRPSFQRLEITATINRLLNGFDRTGFDRTGFDKTRFDKTRFDKTRFDRTRDRHSFPVIIGNTPEIARVRKMAHALKYNNDAVLIQGEKGTGKELLARSIHIAAKENGHSFVKTNISEQLFKSVETDMRKYHREINRIIPYKGNPIFENEDGGTIYLEEIDTIPASFQGVLLQLFEGEQAKKIRVIASSHLKIDHLVRKGVFRKDLYFRLNVIKINIPPLRERKTDIPLLADFFANKFCMESGICHFQLSDRAKKAMTAYPWPNNIQELESFMTTDNFMGSEDRIIDRMNALIEENSRHGLDNLNGEKISGSMNEGPKRVSLKEISKKFAGRIETEILKLVLEKTNWNRKQAAETLMISYKSLLNKIKAYNLN